MERPPTSFKARAPFGNFTRHRKPLEELRLLNRMLRLMKLTPKEDRFLRGARQMLLHWWSCETFAAPSNLILQDYGVSSFSLNRRKDSLPEVSS
jgi:hypothetical protein